MHATLHLREITHKLVVPKKGFTEWLQSFPIPMKMLHLDEIDNDVKEYIFGQEPCVIGKTTTDFKIVLSRLELEKCAGDFTIFKMKLYEKCNL